MSYNITCIEFFDSTDIENICVALTGTIDRIILFGSRKTPMDAAKKHYEKVLAARKYNTQISVEVVKDNCENFFAAVVDGIEQLALRYGTGTDAEGRENVCMFDLTGGEDLPLVAAGIVYERVRERCNIQMHRFNLATTKPEKLVVNFDETSAQTFLEGFQPQLSVAEYLRFAGAKVIEEAFAWPDEALHPDDAAYRAYVEEFRADIDDEYLPDEDDGGDQDEAAAVLKPERRGAGVVGAGVEHVPELEHDEDGEEEAQLIGGETVCRA